MRLGSLRSVPVAAPSVQGKPCKARNGRWTGRPHRESPRASVSASPVTIYHNACLKTQSDRLLGNPPSRQLDDAQKTICSTVGPSPSWEVSINLQAYKSLPCP